MHLKMPLRFITILGYLVLVTGCASIDTQKAESDVSIDSKVPDDYGHALSAAKNGKTKRAIELLQTIADNNPTFSPAFTNLGLQYLKSKNHQQAEAAFRKALNINPKDAVASNHLGVVLRFNGQFNDAKSMYTQAIKHQPDYALAHYNLGILYDIYLYELPLALDHYKQYLSLSDKDDEMVKQWITDLELRINQQANKG